jgi:hypothetical protein
MDLIMSRIPRDKADFCRETTSKKKGTVSKWSKCWSFLTLEKCAKSLQSLQSLHDLRMAIHGHPVSSILSSLLSPRRWWQVLGMCGHVPWKLCGKHEWVARALSYKWIKWWWESMTRLIMILDSRSSIVGSTNTFALCCCIVSANVPRKLEQTPYHPSKTVALGQSNRARKFTI